MNWWLFDFIANIFKPEPKRLFNYIRPTDLSHKSGWQKVEHPSKWVTSKLLNAPDYNPEQGLHYYPYCRGRHFEYCYCDFVYRRRIRR